METMKEQIKNTHSLQELADLLNRFSLLHSDLDRQEYKNIDFSNLPLFGGDEPLDTVGIFSWDKDNLMIYEDSWEIISREKYSEQYLNESS